MSNKYDWLLKKTPRSVDAMKLWPQNPRLDPDEDYSTILEFTEEITREASDRKDFIDLAKSFVYKGFIPADLVVVWQGNDKKYYVAEGNRRVLGLKLLRNPEGAPKSIRATFKKLARRIDRNSIDKVPVSVAPTFEDAEWYISQRNSMSSLQKRWYAEQQRRWIMELYNKYNGDIEVIRSKIDLSESDLQKNIRILKLKEMVHDVKDLLTASEYEEATSIKFPITTFERFFSSSKVRDLWGIEFDDYDVTINSDHETFLKAFSEVIKRILLPKGNGNRIDSRSINGNDILTVLESLPVVADATQDPFLQDDESDQDEETTVENEDVPDNEETPPAPKPKDDPNRNRLIHGSYNLVSDQYRLVDVFEELKKIPFSYPNSIAASIRIFLDLAVLNYITTNNLTSELQKEYKLTLRDITLKKRLSFIKDKSSGKIETIISQLLNSSNTYSLDVLNGYQHSTDHHFIEKKHLNKFWDFLFPLFQVLVVINEE